MMLSVSDFCVLGGFDDGWLETKNLDDRAAYHLQAHVDASGMINVCLEKLPTVPVEPWRTGGRDNTGLKEYTGGGMGGFMAMGLVERPVAIWEGDACGTCKVGSVAGFCDVFGCGRVQVGTERATVEVLVSSCVMVSVQRAATCLAPDHLDYWSSVPVRITCGGYTFVKDVPLDMGVDGELLVSGAEKLLAEFLGHVPDGCAERVLLDREAEEDRVRDEMDHEAGWGNLSTLQPRVSLDGSDDDVVSVVSGWGGDVGFEEDFSAGVGLGERQDDFLFLRSGGAVEKSRSVAGMLLALLRHVGGPELGQGGGVVLVFGDAPGVIARELARHDIRVLGVDCSSRHAAPEGWQASYRTVRATLTEGLTVGEVEEWLTRVNWGGAPILAAVGDIDQGPLRTAAVDSVLNRSLVEMVRANWAGSFGIVRYRGVPPMPIKCAILNTRHHEPQGAEAYAIVGLEGPVVDSMTAFTISSWSLDGDLTLDLELKARSWRDYARDRYIGWDYTGKIPKFTGVVRLTGADAYLAFLGQRNGVEERWLSQTPFMRAGLEARGVVELIGALRLVMGKVRPERVAELTAKFQPADRVHTRHVSMASLSVSSTLLRTMQVRYDLLARSCSAAEEGTQGPDLGQFVKHPGFGALFHWGFSRIRDEMGVVFPYTQFKRVLPLAAMPILASRSWVRMIAWLLRAYDRLMGKPLHTWELQGLLWSLSHVGTQEEREVYFWGRLLGAADMLLASRRRGQRTAHAASADLSRVLNAMEALGVRKLALAPVERIAMVAAYAKAGRGQFHHDDDYRRGPPSGVRRTGAVRSPGSSTSSMGRLELASPPHRRVGSSGSVPGPGGYAVRRVG